MPRYDFRCTNGHVREIVTSYVGRDDAQSCEVCGEPMARLFPLTNSPPSGVYSYQPNIGHPDTFDRKWEQLRAEGKLPKRGK